LSQDLLDQFSRSFHQMKGICANFLDPDLSKFGTIYEMPFIQHAGILQWIRISQFDLEMIKATIFATFHAMLVKIGPLTPEIMQGISVPVGTRQQKSTSCQISQQILDRTSPSFRIGRLMYADYKTKIIFAVVDETLLW